VSLQKLDKDKERMAIEQRSVLAAHRAVEARATSHPAERLASANLALRLNFHLISPFLFLTSSCRSQLLTLHSFSSTHCNFTAPFHLLDCLDISSPPSLSRPLHPAIDLVRLPVFLTFT
jgi:hypothetical protein